MPFQFSDSSIKDVKIIAPKIFSDDRGLFLETYKKSEFSAHGILDTFVQENVSISKKNVLRGLHYQLNPKAQGKLVSAISGSIFDVAVDIRKQSPTFGKYVSIKLNSDDGKMFWIPPGFAHGFLSLEDNTRVAYKITGEYSHEHERGILWNDPDIGIDWPYRDVIIVDRDSRFPKLREAEINFTYGETP
ncbi:MAG: dTDP-4-dehydrorhamnose 3,5-epimerase [Thermoplasmataceae archaeon]